MNVYMFVYVRMRVYLYKFGMWKEYKYVQNLVFCLVEMKKV